MKKVLVLALFVMGITLATIVYAWMHNDITTATAICGGTLNLAVLMCIGRKIDRIEENEND